MARYIKQFRYYNEDNNDGHNQPSKISFRNLVSGSVFNDCFPIIQLGIQSLPGTKFYLNNSKESVIIGNTGVYELDLSGKTEITSLSFDSKSVQAINVNDNAYLIIDIIYEKPED